MLRTCSPLEHGVGFRSALFFVEAVVIRGFVSEYGTSVVGLLAGAWEQLHALIIQQENAVLDGLDTRLVFGLFEFVFQKTNTVG